MRTMALRGLLSLAAALALAGPARAEQLSVLDNGVVRVGVDLQSGGRIAYLARSHGAGDNVLSDSEQSYYGGPLLDGSTSWVAQNQISTVVAHSNDGKTLYARSFGAGCECTLEEWVTLSGHAVNVRNRLTSHRTDTSAYPPTPSELPALYTLGPLHRLVTYDGSAPYTDAPVDDLSPVATGAFFVPDAHPFDASEHWAALLDDHDFGIGLFEPGLRTFVGLSGYEGGWPAGYIAGTRLEHFDANIVYSYDYTLVLGSLSRIRAYAYAHRPDPRPVFLFRKDRQHFVEWNVDDAGFPITGALRLRVDLNDPQLVRDNVWFPARRVPALYIRGAWHTRQNLAELFWGRPTLDYPFSGDRRQPFAVHADGRFHTYRVLLRGAPGYTGTIGALRLDPVPDAEQDGLVDVTCISWKPCPVDRKAERTLLASPGLPLLDPFDRLDTSFWGIGGNSAQTSVGVVDGRLEIDVPAATAPLSGQAYVSTGVYSRCSLAGDFDVQVDYRLLEWPDANGVNLNFSVGDRTLFRHNFTGGDGVSSYFPPSGGYFHGDDSLSGSLRLVRKGGTVHGYFLDPEVGWVQLDVAPVVRSPVTIGLSIYTNRSPDGAADVRVAFDNLRVTRGSLSCP